MDLPILYEDDLCIAINKPPGLVVNRAQSVKGSTVQDWVEDNGKIQLTNGEGENEDFYNRSGIVHRIDKETSGILLIAKTPQSFGALQAFFKERIVKKTYLAIVHGKLVPQEGEISAPVGRLPWNPERFGIVPEGKESVTKYKVESTLKREDEMLSVVHVFPETGRTHQIRVHLKYINHPIVGDYLYAGRKTARDDRKWAPRVMLHAWKISFPNPSDGETLAIVAPIPDDMNTIIKTLA